MVQEEEPTQPSDPEVDQEPEREAPSTTKVICASDLEIGRMAALKDLCEEIGGGVFVSKIDKWVTYA